MSRIFISHSRANNSSALAIAQWLDELGWGDYFLDISGDRGLLPGERWQQALRLAADRCEAVLFLISPAWRDSRWCLAEFLLAKQLGKRVFGVLVESTPLETLPTEMTAEWQLCDLVSGTERRSFVVAHDPVVPPTTLSLGETGLGRLKLGLQRARLGPTTFVWPPPSDPDRAPYRGLKPLEAEDAAVFFGREGAIVRGLDALRQLRERGIERMLVIVGASGAGKSSYLRAGLWPRLQRDDRLFLPMPVIRPGRAVLTGPSGLIVSLDAAFKRQKKPRNRAEIFDALRKPEGLALQLTELQERMATLFEDGMPAPTVVIPIDQSEELFDAEGRAESQAFLTSLREALHPANAVGSGSHAGVVRAIALLGIRSESLQRLQEEPSLGPAGRVLFGLDPLPAGALKPIIEGPADRSTAAGKPLKVEPELTEHLLQDAAGADALPLLAFTLERLFLDYGSDGVLSLGDYEALGKVRGAIEAAIQGAFSDPGRQPAIPVDAGDRERSLKRGFIPWLAIIDPVTNEPRRRVARWNEIPEEAQPLLDRLIEVRLLVRDRRVFADGSDNLVIEIAHEALLRHWPTLVRWLEEDADALKAAEAVGRAAREWLDNERNDAWLVHTGERLVAAEALRRRPDFDALMADAGRDYLLACRARDERVWTERDAQVTRIAAEQSRTARAQRLAKWLLAAVGAVLLLLGGWVVIQSRDVARQRSAVLSVASEQALTDHSYGRALRFAVLAARSNWLSPTVPEAEPQLARAAFASPEITRTTLQSTVNAIAFSPDGQRLVVGLDDRTARVFDLRTWKELARVVHGDAVKSAAFSPDGKFLVTGSDDMTARVSDTRTGKEILNVLHTDRVRSVAVSPDGQHIATIAGQLARLTDVQTGNQIAQIDCDTRVWSIAFSTDGRRLVAACGDKTARVVDAQTGREISRTIHKDEVYSAVFSPDGSQFATAAEDDTARVVETQTGKEITHFDADGEVMFVAFTPDGQRIVTASDTSTVAALSVDKAAGPVWQVSRHTGKVFASVALSPDGRSVLAAGDRTVWVFDIRRGEEIAQIIHDSPVKVAAFSSDGQRLVTADESHTVRLIEVRSREEISGFSDGRVAFSADGKRLTNGEQIADTVTHTLIAQLRNPVAELSAAFSPDGQRVLTRGRFGIAVVLDTQSAKEIARIEHRGADILSATFSPDGHRIVSASSDKTARISDAQTGQELRRVVHDGPVNTAVFSADGQRVATASDDKSARVVDVKTGKEIVRVRHEGPVKSVAFSPDGLQIATASDDRTARVVDIETGRQIVRLIHDAQVASVAFSPDGRRIVTDANRTIRVWDARTGVEIARLDKPGALPTFSPDGQRLVTTSGVYDARTGKEIAGVDAVSDVLLSPDGERIAFQHYQGNLRVIDTRYFMRHGPDLIDIVCSEKLVGTRVLTPADVAAAPVLSGRQGEDVCR